MSKLQSESEKYNSQELNRKLKAHHFLTTYKRNWKITHQTILAEPCNKLKEQRQHTIMKDVSLQKKLIQVSLKKQSKTQKLKHTSTLTPFIVLQKIHEPKLAQQQRFLNNCNMSPREDGDKKIEKFSLKQLKKLDNWQYLDTASQKPKKMMLEKIQKRHLKFPIVLNTWKRHPREVRSTYAFSEKFVQR